MDFDKFKRINDSFGHTFGDKALVEIAKRLQGLAGEDGTAARQGGDEFLVVLPLGDFQSLADRIIKGFQQPLIVDGSDVLLTASMGIASFPNHTENLDELYKFADLAMYYAKENGSNGFSVYDEIMKKETLEKIEMERDLKSAIDGNELMLYFQPKFNTSKHVLNGSEVLLRWHHPLKGFIPPNKFIPVAEESGLIFEIGKVRYCRSLFHHSCLERIRKRNQPSVYKYFLSNDFTRRVCRIYPSSLGYIQFERKFFGTGSHRKNGHEK